MSSPNKGPQRGSENTGTSLKNVGKRELKSPYLCELKLNRADNSKKGSYHPMASRQPDANGTNCSSHERQPTSSSSLMPIQRSWGANYKKSCNSNRGECDPMSRWKLADANDGPWDAIGAVGGRPAGQQAAKSPQKKVESAKDIVGGTKDNSKSS